MNFEFLKDLAPSVEFEVDVDKAIMGFREFNTLLSAYLEKYNQSIDYAYKNYINCAKEWVVIDFRNSRRSFELARPLDWLGAEDSQMNQRVLEQVLLAHAVRECLPQFTGVYLNTEMRKKDVWVTPPATEEALDKALDKVQEFYQGQEEAVIKASGAKKETVFDQAMAAKKATAAKKAKPVKAEAPAAEPEIEIPEPAKPSADFGAAINLLLSDDLLMARLAKAMNNPVDAFIKLLSGDLAKHQSTDTLRLRALMELAEMDKPEIKDYLRIIRNKASK